MQGQMVAPLTCDTSCLWPRSLGWWGLRSRSPWPGPFPGTCRLHGPAWHQSTSSPAATAQCQQSRCYKLPVTKTIFCFKDHIINWNSEIKGCKIQQLQWIASQPCKIMWCYNAKCDCSVTTGPPKILPTYDLVDSFSKTNQNKKDTFSFNKISLHHFIQANLGTFMITTKWGDKSSELAPPWGNTGRCWKWWASPCWTSAASPGSGGWWPAGSTSALRPPSVSRRSPGRALGTRHSQLVNALAGTSCLDAWRCLRSPKCPPSAASSSSVSPPRPWTCWAAAPAGPSVWQKQTANNSSEYVKSRQFWPHHWDPGSIGAMDTRSRGEPWASGAISWVNVDSFRRGAKYHLFPF